MMFSGASPETTYWLEQFLKRPFLPAARAFSGRSRHFYKAVFRRGTIHGKFSVGVSVGVPGRCADYHFEATFNFCR